MKKMLIVFIVLILPLSSLMACSGDSEESNADVPEGATEIVLWNLFSGGDADYFKNIVKKFNKSQSDFYVKSIFQTHDDYYTKLITSLSAGKGPDIAVAHEYVLPELISDDLIMNLDELASDADLDWEGFNKNILEATVFDEKHYAVPLDTHALIMFQNNEMLSKAGLLSKDGSIKMKKTPEGFIDMLSTLKEKLPNGKIAFANGSEGTGLYWLWWTYYTQLGAEGILSDDIDDPKYILDKNKAVRAAKYIKQFFEKQLIPKNLKNPTAKFKSGDAAFVATGVWDTGLFSKEKNLDFTPIPVPNTFNQKSTWGGSHTLVIPSQNVDKEVQKGAIKFMDFATKNGAMWAKAGHIPSKTSVVKSDKFKDLPHRKEYAEVADYVHFDDLTKYTRGLKETVTRELDKIWAGKATSEEVFSGLESKVKKLVDE